ncbi:glycosyltransferase [Methylobacterium sp. NEAU K]|uniref:glycosyltransferase n=1 Tax=Methylobacterium sp. NEAU K TaxID=3064946 RepID=UPI002734F977|nr:glycosyltransferase [Methylobacterium sp. NEAU K]MDP4006937.1 glycosyltransferase [Methylobacterium sp. NEAU K]
MALHGHVDWLSHRQMIGWARDDAAPDTAVSLVVSVDGRVVGRCLADRPRDDLVRAGIGHGRHGFDFAFPAGALPALARCTVAVRQEGDGAMLPGSPRALDPITAFDEDLQERLAQALAEPVDDVERDRRLAFLLNQVQRLRSGHAERRNVLSCQSRPRALVIDAVMPGLGRDAGSNAILSHMRSLQRLGYAVTFVPTDLWADGAALEAEGITCCLHPWYASVEEVLRRNAGAFALVYLHRVDTAGRYSQLARDTQRSARLIYSVADLHHLRIARQADVEDRADLAAYAEHLRFLELTAACAADAVITHSIVEAALLRRHIPGERVHVVPWAVSTRPTTVPFAERQGLAFIGGYGHRPNVDAAHLLIEAVMPEVATLSPAKPCLLVGSRMPESLRTLAASRPHIEAVGHVVDLESIFDRVRLTVAPLAYGAGVKGKVLDSLAAGVPCVCTPAAAEGIVLPKLIAELVADTPVGLARSIAALHGDEPLNRACAKAGLAFVAEQCREARVDAQMRAVVGLPTLTDPALEVP